MHPLLRHYLLVALFSSLISSVFFMIVSPQSEPMLFSQNDIVLFTIFFAAISYCFVLIGGALVSSIVRYFTSTKLIIFLVFLILAFVLYLINPLVPSSILLIASTNSFLFGMFDVLFDRKIRAIY